MLDSRISLAMWQLSNSIINSLSSSSSSAAAAAWWGGVPQWKSSLVLDGTVWPALNPLSSTHNRSFQGQGSKILGQILSVRCKISYRTRRCLQSVVKVHGTKLRSLIPLKRLQPFRCLSVQWMFRIHQRRRFQTWNVFATVTNTLHCASIVLFNKQIHQICCIIV